MKCWVRMTWTKTEAITRAGGTLVVGLGFGALTSFLQSHFDSPWLSLVNSATPWLVPAFLLCARCRWLASAALVGITVTLAELVGYVLTASLRGYPASVAITVFWGVCALLGGQVFGAAGRLWYRSRRFRSALGASVLAASFLAEGTVTYALRLGYLSSAALFWILGGVTILLLGMLRKNTTLTLLWVGATLPVAMIGELLLGLIYNQRF